MIVERSMHPDWLSNTYLVASGPGSEAFFVDAGGPVEPLLAKADEHSLDVTHVFITHHHHDHVAEIDKVVARWPDARVLSHPDERVLGINGDLHPDEEVAVGDLRVRALHIPGHTSGMLAMHAGNVVFSGDTLYRDSIAGVRAPGHTTYADLKRSIMDVLLALPPETVIRAGHTDATTVAEELQHNPFVRIWRGLDAEGDRPCTALGEPATLILWAPDYDGGHKAWVRWEDGSDDILPGSRVEPR
jgi:hydroxyacylglutathione hydrolase